MSLSFDSALQSLLDTATDSSNSVAERRLRELTSVIGDELGWLELELSRAARLEAEPAGRAAGELMGRGGKRIRPIAVLLSAACFGVVPAAARQVAVVVELVHTATLLHDDVIDEASERRGAPAARLVWGNALSVLSGDALLVQALERTTQHAPHLLSQLLETLRRLVSGEIVQLRGRHRLDLSEATYEGILNDKTASLFRFATRAGAALAGANQVQQTLLADFGEQLGMAFQLVDDVLDYTSQATGKTLLADLSEGKVTLPLVLAAHHEPRLLEWVRGVRAGDSELVAVVRDHVLSSGACDQVRLRARQATERAARLLQGLPESPARRLLQDVARQIVTRDA